MFYYIKGELTYRDMNTCVLDCGGVGYQLTVSLVTSELLSQKIGQSVKLFTHLAVREDGIELFGFISREEKECFNKLISVSGVGPKAAMNILSTLTTDKLALAICTEDIKAIAASPGIGSKTAARIILELRDKISKEMMNGEPVLKNLNTAPSSAAIRGNMSEACEALAVLGYDKNTILSAIKDIAPENEVGEIIRLALKKLSK